MSEFHFDKQLLAYVIRFFVLVATILSIWSVEYPDAGASEPESVRHELFQNPPIQYKSRPLWFWNKPDTSAEEIRKIMAQSYSQSGYSGFGILPAADRDQYLKEPYFGKYGVALQTAAELGMKMCLYDEYWFPSGSAGGQFARQFPELVMKRLDMKVDDVGGPMHYTATIPDGTLMGVVAMNMATKERIDITARVNKEKQLIYDVPAGDWKIMIFTCSPEGPIMDYMNREATEKFLQITHEQYYRRFKDHFGTTIDIAFYDEPTLYRNHGRAWTETFNRKFQERLGHSPVPYYPALWFDIGEDTAAARIALFGFRAELFATQYIKVMDDWCREHQLKLTGHMDQEQIANVTLISGDLLKVFKYQAIPGIDEIGHYGRTQRAYKIISSAAYNYDKPLVMSETYGAIKNMPVSTLYRMAMDLYAKGINLMVPHAVWTNTQQITFPPELSWRHPEYGPALPAYNRYIGRLNLLLQHGRHVADIAVLYPIATLQAATRFDVGKPYAGGPVVPEADYMNIGEMLSLEVRRDFTYLHPEVLNERCTVDGNILHLKNSVNYEQYRILLMPGGKTIYAGNLRKIKKFYDAGGIVIATTQLPFQSAEFGHNEEIRQNVRRIFGIDPDVSPKNQAKSAGANNSEPTVVRNANPNGGKAYFVPQPNAGTLKTVMDQALDVYDVVFEDQVSVKDGNLSYIHKSRPEHEIYFFANSSATPVDVNIRLCGKMNLELWDPHTGQRTTPEFSQQRRAERNVTVMRLILPPQRSIFVVGSVIHKCHKKQ